MYLPSMSSLEAVESIGSILVATGTLYAGFKSVLGSARRKREAYRTSIIDEAKTYSELVQKQFETKILSALEEIEKIRLSVDNDLFNLKENHTIALKNLDDKVQLLRIELQDQSRGILALLTKLVDKQ